MDLIQILKDKVSPIVMQNENGYLLEKHQALNQFYPLLLTVLKNRPELITSLKNQLQPSISALFSAHPHLKTRVLETLSQDAPVSEIESVLDQSMVPTLAILEQEAGSSDAQAIQHLLEQNDHATLRQLSPALAAILASMGFSTAVRSPTEPSYQHVVTEDRGSNWWKWILGLILLALLLAFLLKSCRSDEKPAAVDLQANESAYFSLKANTNGDVEQCHIVTGDENLIQSIQTHVQQTWVGAVPCTEEVNTRYSSSFIDVDAIPSVLGVMKTMPNSKLLWSGDQLSLETDATANREQLAEQLQTIAPNMKIHVSQAVESTLGEREAIDRSIAESQQRLSALTPSNVTALDIATALNIQIINFASASDAIPEENKMTLNQAATLLKQKPEVKLSVNGHTDATGDASMNQTLSERRAQSVVAYLLSQGVQADQLTAVGYGQTRPIADNNTAEGKFKNRRIEFEVYNPETGITRKVDETGVTEQ